MLACGSLAEICLMWGCRSSLRASLQLSHLCLSEILTSLRIEHVYRMFLLNKPHRYLTKRLCTNRFIHRQCLGFNLRLCSAAAQQQMRYKASFLMLRLYPSGELNRSALKAQINLFGQISHLINFKNFHHNRIWVFFVSFCFPCSFFLHLSQSETTTEGLPWRVPTVFRVRG